MGILSSCVMYYGIHYACVQLWHNNYFRGRQQATLQTVIPVANFKIVRHFVSFGSRSTEGAIIYAASAES